MPNMMYHFVGSNHDLMGISFSKFKKQLDFLQKSYPPDELVLTFDHGTIDHINIAAPELERRNLKGVFFLLTTIQEEGRVPTIDKQRRLEAKYRKTLANMLCLELEIPYQPELAQDYLSEFLFYSLEERYLRLLRDDHVSRDIYERFIGKHFFEAFGSEEDLIREEYLSWDHVKQLHERGHIIGSHSHAHIGDKKDFERSLHAIGNKIGEKPRHISYPNGMKRISDEELKELNVELAYLSSAEGSYPYKAPRIDCNQFLESPSQVV